MRTLTVEWTQPDTFDVRVDGIPLAFEEGAAARPLDGAEHYLSWSAWAKPNTTYKFSVSIDGAEIHASKPGATIGKKQVAFGAIRIDAEGQP